MSENTNMVKKGKLNIDMMALLMIATPLILAGIVAIYYYIVNGGIAPVPGLKWNDEAAYYQLIKTCVTTGQPVGYWGFNGNHALVGTGSAWSPAIIWPYAIFAFVFPLSKGLVYFVNLFYITLANVIFYFCVRPNRRQCIKLALAQATSAVFIVYLSVNMSELFRYAIAIVLAGLLYRIIFCESSKLVKYVITPLVIVGAAQVYVFFAFCVPVYIFGIMKKSKLWQKLVVSAGALGVVAFGSYYLLHLISSNYNIHKTEALLGAVKQMDIPGALVAFLRMMKQGAGDVFRLWTYVYSNPLIPFHVVFAAVLVLVSVGIVIAFMVKKKGKDADDKESSKKPRVSFGKDAIIAIIAAYSVILFFGMYMTLYSIDPFTFMRGTYIVVIFAMYLLAMSEGKWIYRGLLILQAISLFFLPVNMDYYMTGHYMDKAVYAEWDALEEAVSGVLVVDETKGAWENTVAMYTMEPKAICAMPGGIGVNFIMEDGVLPEEAEYLFVSLIPAAEQSTEWIVRDYEVFYGQYAQVLEEEYVIIYDDGEYRIYQQK